MGGSSNTQQILNTSVQVLNALLQWSEALSAQATSRTGNKPTIAADSNDFEKLQTNLAFVTGNKFYDLFSYAFNGDNSVPPDWDKSAGNRYSRQDFVNVPTDATDIIQNYINSTIAQQAPDFCRDNVENDLQAMVNQLLQVLPTEGFTQTMFTKTYNNDSTSGPKAVKLDSCLYYTSSVIYTNNVPTNYLFLYMCGIYYPSQPWVDGMGHLNPQVVAK